jgi:hypothetical protein
VLFSGRFEAKKLKDEYISVEHVLLAATDDRGAADAC